MKYSVGTSVRLSRAARKRIILAAEDTEHIRVAREGRLGVVIQWISEQMQPTGYLVEFKSVYMALGEEDLVAVE